MHPLNTAPRLCHRCEIANHICHERTARGMRHVAFNSCRVRWPGKVPNKRLDMCARWKMLPRNVDTRTEDHQQVLGLWAVSPWAELAYQRRVRSLHRGKQEPRLVFAFRETARLQRWMKMASGDAQRRTNHGNRSLRDQSDNRGRWKHRKAAPLVKEARL